MRRDSDLWDVLGQLPQSCAWHEIAGTCMEHAFEYDFKLHVAITFCYRLSAAHPFPVVVRDNAVVQDRSGRRTGACCLLVLQACHGIFLCILICSVT